MATQDRNVRGASCNEVVCGRESACEACPASKVFASGEMSHSEMQFKSGGQPRFIYLTAMPIKSPYGETEEVLIMLQDVSDLSLLKATREPVRVPAEDELGRECGRFAPIIMK